MLAAVVTELVVEELEAVVVVAAVVLTELAVEELELEAVVVAEGLKALTNCCLAFCTHCARFVLICCNC